MKLNKKTPVVFAAALALNSFMVAPSFAHEKPVPVADYVNDGATVVENTSELSTDDIASLEQQWANDSSSSGDSSDEYVRIRNLNPSTDTGKIIIRVHESNVASTPEYLEVFRQKSADPNDLEALNLFDNDTSNRALVSTAGTFPDPVTHQPHKYTTPPGNFAFDQFQLMHHSKTYNDAPMPFSMFFNEGIAIHAATPGEYKMLGKMASHGCVRTHLDTAKALYNYITPAGRGNAVVEVMAATN